MALRFALPGCSVKRAADPADVASGKVPIIAPGTIRAFDKFAIGENVVAGNAMSRRAGYAFGNLLDFGPEQFVSCGIAVGSVVGPLTVSYSRDARNFARYIDETLELWGEHAEVHYGLHTWPVWGRAEVVAFLESQRDTDKYIHDQAFRLANKGYTPLEAAEVIELPEELPRKWFNRGYHGTLHHDVRAVYTKELGMWDGDPVSLPTTRSSPCPGLKPPSPASYFGQRRPPNRPKPDMSR